MKLLYILLALIFLSCKKENQDKTTPLDKKEIKVLNNDSISITIPNSWEIIKDSSFIFSGIISQSKKEEQFILLNNKIKNISIKSYLLEDLRIATDNNEIDSLDYFIHKYYLENNDYCYILETFPTENVGVFSFVREYNGNIYDLTFKSYKVKKGKQDNNQFYQVLFSFTINGQKMFPIDSIPVIIGKEYL
ncbi:MAG: hypothetical protein LBV67_12030 [Streptococcaceae bacterium]|jgi:hypothetical protein|nr:hypothetical protein [Streptococcaceae bacterium]